MIAVGLAASACESDSTVLEINATGAVSGVVFVDRNANGVLDAQVDGPAPNVSVVLTAPASQQVIARTTTSSSGLFIFPNVPVGRYGVNIEAPTLGDSLRLAGIDSATITVAARDTSVAIVTVGYQQIALGSLGTIPVGRRVIVQGIALNAWAAFGDSTLHLADNTAVIRAVRVQPINVIPGDTVRLLGTVALVNNMLTIADAVPFRIGTGALTRPQVVLSTALAASASNNTLQNDLVRIRRAVIINTQPGTDLVVSVDDGSGIVQLVLDQSGGFGGLQNMVPGALVDATGVLVPRDNGGWQLKPRSVSDITIAFEQVTVAQARTLPVGRLVQIEGLALNGWITFGDASVHIVDPTGSLRTTQVNQSTLFAGDSVRMVGRTALREGQPVLTLVQPTVLLNNRTLPAPVELTTARAATADNGALDAALVRVRDVTVMDTATVAGNFVMTVGTTAAPLRVVIVAALGLRTSSYTPGTVVDVTGLLVPAVGGATHQLRPRSAADIVIVTPAPSQLSISGAGFIGKIDGQRQR